MLFITIKATVQSGYIYIYVYKPAAEFSTCLAWPPYLTKAMAKWQHVAKNTSDVVRGTRQLQGLATHSLQHLLLLHRSIPDASSPCEFECQATIAEWEALFEQLIRHSGSLNSCVVDLLYADGEDVSDLVELLDALCIARCIGILIYPGQALLQQWTPTRQLRDLWVELSEPSIFEIRLLKQKMQGLTNLYVRAEDDERNEILEALTNTPAKIICF